MDIRPHPIKLPIVRFMALIKISAEHFHNGTACWDWQGSKGSCGYGQFVLDGRRDRKRVRIAPYRFIWEHFNGPMDEGLEPDHLCNRRACCNPEHIEPVTHAENQRRAYERGRKRPHVDYVTGHKRGTHCPHGHEYTPKNAYTTPKGTIYCRECNRIACAARKTRLKAA